MSLKTMELLGNHLRGMAGGSGQTGFQACSSITNARRELGGGAPVSSSPLPRFSPLTEQRECSVLPRVDEQEAVPDREGTGVLDMAGFASNAAGFGPSGGSHAGSGSGRGPGLFSSLSAVFAGAGLGVGSFEERLTPRPNSVRGLGSGPPKRGSVAPGDTDWAEVTAIVAGPTPHTSGDQVTRWINDREVAGTAFDIPEDTYGAAILTIVKEAQEIYRGSNARTRLDGLMRGAFALALLVFNLVLQFCLLGFMDWQVVGPAVHHVQTRYKEFHAVAYDSDGAFRSDLWSSYDGKSELCQIVMTNRPFLCSILFIWTTAILQEFRLTVDLVSILFRMPLCQHGGLMMLVEHADDRSSIVALTQQTRWLVLLIVCVPKFAISAYLLELGYRWLSATTSFENLVMNTVSMSFVMHIDEMLFNTFLPSAYRKLVSEIDFFVEQMPHDFEQASQTQWRSYAASAIYLLVAFSGVLLYVIVLQEILPSDLTDVRSHCHRYMGSLQPVCSTGAASCYPFGGGREQAETSRRLLAPLVA